ncbi:ABC transporter permease [Reichenbachiella sp. MALMAid0571]|uniref:ABC transporter permease n=1 Tax=Reichenbachiella sp. MALMAid0571 TaxID=3143939 RepID=UPI0032DF54E6
MKIFRLVLESFRFAWQALKANLLRTTLSLLGVTVGIFAIIAVFTLVDSLERSINKSFDFLGSDNINVEKWPYSFGGGQYPWWKYLNRPYPTYDEYKFLSKNANNQSGITIFASKGGVTVKNKNSSSGGISIVGASYGHNTVYDIPIETGRFFSIQETENAVNVAIAGNRLVKELFPFQSPLGQEIKIKGLKYTIIGTLKEEGESFIGTPSNDDNIYIPYKSFTKLYYVGRKYGIGSSISLKGKKDDPGLFKLEGELRGLMRGRRGLKPKEDDDFALNKPEALSNFIGNTFDILGIAGAIIGSFSILVGGFGIANIMFVSVRERTNIIGIQKSLGAKNYFILYQFLFESVFLSLLGGLIGLAMVYLLTFLQLGSLELVMTAKNIVIGLGVSCFIGILSGIIPAAMAARLDPVIAIRTN